MSSTFLIVLLVVVTALAFDFTNGFHDSANAMATSVATGALKPRVAVLIAGVLNLAGAFLSTAVAKTISGGIVDDAKVTLVIVLAGLAGAILWNLVTWLVGLPSSSSHALFGGLIGAVIVGAGIAGVRISAVISKILLPAVVAPIVAGLAAAAATSMAYRLMRRTGNNSEKGYKYGQTVTASLVALAHGTGDGQKTMGVITLLLITAGYQASGSGPHIWVILAAGLAIGLGTYSGGWRIMRTLGKGLVDIQAPQGFAAETASSAAILASSHLGFGLSTTHVCAGSIMGAGVGRGRGEVRWVVARRMVYAWLLTLPAAALVGGIAAWISGTGTIGTIAIMIALVAAAAVIFRVARRNRISHDNVNDGHEVTIKPAAAAASVGV